MRLLPKLTYANVVATLALIVAVGGASAFAAGQLGKNTVGPKQLKKNAVTEAKIKNEAVTATKIKKGTITGTQINVSTLGNVPSATNATNATNAANAANAQALDGQSASQLLSALKPDCPSQMVLSDGLCFQESASSATEWEFAADDCYFENLRLPTVGELIVFEKQRFPEFDAPPGEWTEPESFNGTESWANVAAASEKGISYGSTVTTESNPFRCVTPASN